MGGQFLSLREAYISNLSLLRSLEPLEKFLGGGWVVLKGISVISPRPRPKSRLINYGFLEIFYVYLACLVLKDVSSLLLDVITPHKYLAPQ